MLKKITIVRLRLTLDNLSLFPDIRTHNFNIPIYNVTPQMKLFGPEYYLNKSLYIVGRERELKNCKDKLNKLMKLMPNIYKYEDQQDNFNEIMLIRGKLGSGKSLFIRKLLYDFLEKKFKDIKYQFIKSSYTIPFVFVSFQSPITNFDSMNAWKPILKQIYTIFCKEVKLGKQIENLKLGSDVIKVNCDIVGKIIFKSFSFGAIKFIEEILDVLFNLSRLLWKDISMYQIIILFNCYLRSKSCLMKGILFLNLSHLMKLTNRYVNFL